MSEKHLARGSAFPPLKDGTIRLYSMRYCPFAQRSRLALAARGIEYETVNCDLKRKAEWLLERNPKGLVPVLEHDGKVVFESLVVNDYLDEVFPGKRTLNPKDPYQKARDSLIIDLFSSQVSANFIKVMRSHGEDVKSVNKLSAGLRKLEAELKKRGTTYFGGSKPGMLDYNMWPWFERLYQTENIRSVIIFGENLPLLKIYIENMMLDEAVKATWTPPELMMKFSLSYSSGQFQYDFDEPVPQSKL